MCSYLPSYTPFSLIFVCFRESYRTQPTLQQGCTRVLHISYQNLRYYDQSARVFNLEILRSSFPSSTRIMAKTFSTRCASDLYHFGLQLHLSFVLVSYFLTLSYVANWVSFFHLPPPRYDNRKTTKGGNYPCRCLLQSQVASVVEFSRQGQNQKSIPLFFSSPWESLWRLG